MMSHSVSSLFAGIALTMFVTACAGPTTQAGSAGLPGMWHGSFAHPGADYTSPSRADLTLQVRNDSTYTFMWGPRAESTGTIAAQGNRVVLNDSSGMQVTLSRSGDTLYGVMKDTATGRAAVMNLAKEESVATQVAETPPGACGRAESRSPGPGILLLRLLRPRLVSVLQPLATPLIDPCITNRHHGHKKAGNSEAVIKDRRSAGRFRAFFVIRHSAAMSSSRLSGRPLASVALKWVQTNSSGFRSGA